MTKKGPIPKSRHTSIQDGVHVYRGAICDLGHGSGIRITETEACTICSAIAADKKARQEKSIALFDEHPVT